MVRLREICGSTGHREFALLFIRNRPKSERPLLMAEFEHLEMMQDAESA